MDKIIYMKCDAAKIKCLYYIYYILANVTHCKNDLYKLKHKTCV